MKTPKPTDPPSRRPPKSASDEAKLLAFVREYLDLRRVQRCYFRSKDVEHLEDAKRREKALDQWAEDVLCLTTPSLFDLPPEAA